MIAIPAIDIFEGKVVRLIKGEFDQIKIYNDDPADQAEKFFNAGFKLIHIVDLEGSKTGSFKILDIIKTIKEKFNVKIQMGGGIRNVRNAEELIVAGVDRVIVGTLSVNNKNEFEKTAEKISPQRIVIAADVKDEKIYSKGWTEDSGINLYDHIEYCLTLGIKNFLATDISKDGLLSGSNSRLYEKIIEKFPGINLIASGGVKDIAELENYRNKKIYGAIVGKAVYENKISLEELKKFAG